MLSPLEVSSVANLESGRPLSIVLTSLVVLAPFAQAADVAVQLGGGDAFVIQDNTGAIERLRVDEATGNLSRNGALFVHTTGTTGTFLGENAGNSAVTGSYNTGFGNSALSSNTAGASNTAFGGRTLTANTTGDRNSALGVGALFSNTTGSYNAAFGQNALLINDTGTSNSAFGRSALTVNSTGDRNTAVGARALLISMGDDNVGLGYSAGENLTFGSDNIYIANSGGSESGQIRIGTTGTHTDAFIAGIAGNVVGGSLVVVSGSGELGVTASSARFKRDVKDMGAASNVLFELRPVTFLYREAVGGANDERQYGLIAEQVAEVAPDLVDFDGEGRPFSVHYERLAPMLLNELQKQQRTDEEQSAVVENQRRTIASLVARLEALERELAQVREGG